MEMAYVAQQEVITALHEIGDHDLAARLERCMNARRERHYGDGWPFSCRSAACVWCRRAMIRGWWAGFTYWSEAATASSLAIIPALSQQAYLMLFDGFGAVYAMSATGRRDAGGNGAL